MEDNLEQGKSDKELEDAYKIIFITLCAFLGLIVGTFIYNLF